MLFVVPKFRIAILAFDNFGTVLSLFKIETVLCEYISAQVLRQLICLIDLDDEVDPLIYQIGRLIRNEVKLFATIGIDRNYVDVQLSMNFKS